MKSVPPGLLRPSVNPDVVMMVCTAGHVDHGKTSLVRLLTGCNTDRLKIEQERGMTIELGFAPCVIGGNLCIGIADVPGHERFIRNMVAGVSGIDMAILVVAADDGVMPQTIEHLEIMELLGVRSGIVALTKIDLVSPERVEEVSQAICNLVAGTFLASARICPMSSETFVGYGEFYEELVAGVSSLSRRRCSGVFRMPVERAFSREGFGTVVTGVAIAGQVASGQELELAPGGGRARVRGLQRFLRDANEGGYGQCLAINLAAVDKLSAERGQVLCAPGVLKPVRQIHAQVRLLASTDKPLRNGEALKFHAGTTEQEARVYVLDVGEIPPGESGHVTVLLDKPAAVAPHDRFILRRPSPAGTIGGGEALICSSEPTRRQRRVVAAELKQYSSMVAGVDPFSEEGIRARVSALLAGAAQGLTVDEIASRALLWRAEVEEVCRRLVGEGQVRVSAAAYYLDARRYGEILGQARAKVEEAIKRDPLLGVTLLELRSALALPTPVWSLLLDDLKATPAFRIQSERVVPAQAPARSSPEAELAGRILELYDRTGFHSPRPEEVAELLKAPPALVTRVMQHLCNEKKLVKLSASVVLGVQACRKAQDLVIRIVKDKGVLDSADFKYHIDSSRKYALAILDYLDARRVTLRIGNDRKLAPGYERNLL